MRRRTLPDDGPDLTVSITARPNPATQLPRWMRGTAAHARGRHGPAGVSDMSSIELDARSRRTPIPTTWRMASDSSLSTDCVVCVSDLRSSFSTDHRSCPAHGVALAEVIPRRVFCEYAYRPTRGDPKSGVDMATLGSTYICVLASVGRSTSD